MADDIGQTHPDSHWHQVDSELRAGGSLCRLSPLRTSSLEKGASLTPRASDAPLLRKKSSLASPRSEGSGSLTRRRSIVFMQNSSRRGSIKEAQVAAVEGQQEPTGKHGVCFLLVYSLWQSSACRSRKL